MHLNETLAWFIIMTIFLGSYQEHHLLPNKKQNNKLKNNTVYCYITCHVHTLTNRLCTHHATLRQPLYPQFLTPTAAVIGWEPGNVMYEYNNWQGCYLQDRCKMVEHCSTGCNSEELVVIYVLYMPVSEAGVNDGRMDRHPV